MAKSVLPYYVQTAELRVKKKLWGGEFWSKGFFLSTVGKHGDERKIANYVKNQGSNANYKTWYQQNPRKFGQKMLWDL